MRKFLLLNAMLFSLTATAQTDSLKWVKEINEQVCKPFITHLVSGNKPAFSAVHSKRITRVEIDRGVLLDFEKYFPPADTKSDLKKKKTDWVFELRFDKRISNGTKAWESALLKILPVVAVDYLIVDRNPPTTLVGVIPSCE